MRWPVLSNNQQFMHALAHMGLDVPTPFADEMNAWERAHMASLRVYEKLASVLEAMDGCQPRDPRFPQMPRLCRKWWDEDHVLACGATKELRLPRFA